MSLGADDYIFKPYDATDLLNTIEGRLKKADSIHKKIEKENKDVDDLTAIIEAEKTLNDFIQDRNVDVYKKKERIYTEGNHPIRLYYVKKGRVKIFKVNEYGKELIIKIVNPGEFFGYIAMLEQSVYKENASALEACEVAAIPANQFEDLIHSHAEVSRKFIRLLANEIAEREEQLLHLAYNSLRRKVADALLSLQAKYKMDSTPSINLSRENLAAVAGTAPESLIRTLTDFKSEGLIDMEDGKIRILNYHKLSNLAN
jgi:CRP-like cAMP-binding protein